MKDMQMKRCYQRAASLMGGLRTQSIVKNDSPLPHWIEGKDYFWYQRYTKRGSEYRLVDINSTSNRLAFDHCALANSLSVVLGSNVNPEDLPISHVVISLFPLTVEFLADNRFWRFLAEENTCMEARRNSQLFLDGSPWSWGTTEGPDEIVSPDGLKIAFIKNYNLWVRDSVTSHEQALTNDGEEFFQYGAPSTAYGMAWGEGIEAQWSPDSKSILTLKRDTRMVQALPMVDQVPMDGQIRPKLKQVKISYPGDEAVETNHLLTIDVANKRVSMAQFGPIPVTAADHGFFTMSRLGWWGADSRRAYFIAQERGDKLVEVVEIDSKTGETRSLFSEVSETHIDIKPEAMDFPMHVYLPYSDELIWWSERSGWGHLYLYDLNSGELKGSITEGDWRVRDILHVDPDRRELWIQTAARFPDRNPYYRDICRVNIDTGEIVILTSSDEEYTVHKEQDFAVRIVAKPMGRACGQVCGVAPSGNYVVTTRSRVDNAPVTLLLDRFGNQLMELESADISKLPPGWQWPESVKIMASDDETEIWGVIFRPSTFKVDMKYPVINMIVGGPWLSAIPKGSFHNSRGYVDRYYFLGSAMAELGFIVVVIDSRGGPLRSKKFNDDCYGWIPSSANVDDHKEALEQLAARYPEMNLDRVGIFSPTGYQGGIQNLLERPDFYKVGVINMLQDSRFVGCVVEGDKYHGVEGPAPDKLFPEQIVKNWNGKIFLIHALYGPIINCYPPASTFRMVEALQKANKDFDLLIVPHVDVLMGSYELRRAWDYFVRHLQGAEPPKEFELLKFLW